MDEVKKFNCFTCNHKRNVAGSANCRCRHPSLGDRVNDPLLEMMAIFAGVGRASPMAVSTKELNIQGDPYGINNGWFNFPWSFDPTWLRNCDGYEGKTRPA